MLTADAIRSINDVKIEKLEIPEWNGCLYIRSFSAAVRESISTRTEEMKSKSLMARFVVASACDESGNLLFTNEDVDALGKKDARVMQRIFKAILNLNAIGDMALTDAVKK